VSYTAPSGSPNDVQPPNAQIDLKARTGDPNQGNVNDPALTQERQADEEYGLTRGVTAVNQDELKSFDFAAGAPQAWQSVSPREGCRRRKDAGYDRSWGDGNCRRRRSHAGRWLGSFDRLGRFLEFGPRGRPRDQRQIRRFALASIARSSV
jgi:hypothetical protein